MGIDGILRAMYPLDAATILGIQRERQKWTTTKPAAAGYYWLRNFEVNGGENNPDPQVAEVYEDICGELVVARAGTDCDFDLKDVNGEWSGPLELPC